MYKLILQAIDPDKLTMELILSPEFGMIQDRSLTSSTNVTIIEIDGNQPPRKKNKEDKESNPPQIQENLNSRMNHLHITRPGAQK